MVKKTNLKDSDGTLPDEDEKWQTLAERAEMRQRVAALSSRDVRRFSRDDAPAAGNHYSEQTGHWARGRAAKEGTTQRARFDLLEGHDSPVTTAWTSDNTGYAKRGDRADARAARNANGGDAVTCVEAGEAATTIVDKVGRRPRAERDKGDTQPQPTRGRR